MKGGRVRSIASAGRQDYEVAVLGMAGSRRWELSHVRVQTLAAVTLCYRVFLPLDVSRLVTMPVVVIPK